MNNTFSLLCEYNKTANQAVIDLVRSFDPSEFDKDRGSFAGSIHGLLDHIAEGELYFQRQIRDAYPSLTFLNHRWIDRKTVYRSINFPDRAELFNVLTTCDGAFVRALREIPVADTDRQIVVHAFDGDKRWPLSLLVVQAVNHGTHHRGQLSQILDELKIDHDFSGIRSSYD